MARSRITVFCTMLLAIALVLLPARTSMALNADVTHTHELVLKTTVLTVRFVNEPDDDARQAILAWIRKSARAVSVYYGRFPVDAVTIAVSTFPGRGVRGGRAFGGLRPRIVISAGTSSTQADFANDWRMVHEMIHMAFPMLDQRHHWMTEGLAVYVESIARLQATDIDEATVWKGFVDGMQNGLPRKGDKGLDHTPTWGRTYWGGAIFCLVADLEIRKRTNGNKSLQDALRAIIGAGGTNRTRWPLKKALEVGDTATGTTVLMNLYEAWRATPVDPRLPELWNRLGVVDKGRTVAFDDTAALALTRKEMGRRTDY